MGENLRVSFTNKTIARLARTKTVAFQFWSTSSMCALLRHSFWLAAVAVALLQTHHPHTHPPQTIRKHIRT